jgi:outer membrane protein OmpA-like peptidoglycan-associated protein
MKGSLGPIGFALLFGLSGSTVTAQTSSQTPPLSQSSQPSDVTRPATTTFYGDTGLWYVPSAEVLPGSKWSLSGYRRATNYIQGYTNVADFAGTFAIGIKDRAEIFGSFIFDTRIDRDVTPVFVSNPTYGGIIDRYPKVNTSWTSDRIGDVYVGAKLNLMSESRREPAAIAVRGIIKVPTANQMVGTGKADFAADFVASKDAGHVVELAGYGGWEFRGSPDGFNNPTGSFRWGGGAAVPSHRPLRAFGEVTGDVVWSDTATITGPPLIATDGTSAPLTSNTENLTRVTAGIAFQAPKGFFVGAGVSWNVPQQARNPAHTVDTPFGDYWDWQVRVGYHPGVRVYVPPPPPEAPPPPPPPPTREHTLTVKAECKPCTVEVGTSSTVSATAQSSIGCAVTYRWAAPTGTVANPAERQTLWTAPKQEGAVPVTVTVTCPTDNRTASDTVNLQVVRLTPKTYAFEDVHFDFDRYSLRPEATRVLDEAVSALRQDPTLRVTIEGHTCNIGTAEYNLALGERRANAVRDYFVSNGIVVSRLQTISYGEERPKYDNAREESRRLNRRASLVVNLQR